MAFPTTSVLDDFNRASLGSNWTLDPYGWGANSWSIVSNQLSRTTNGEPLGAWNVSTYGPDCEIYATVVTKPTTTNDYVALGLGMGTLGTVANEDGYAVELVVNSGGTDTVNICRVDSGTFTTLGASISQEVADGEKLGLERIGSTITAYLYTGGGVDDSRLKD